MKYTKHTFDIEYKYLQYLGNTCIALQHSAASNASNTLKYKAFVYFLVYWAEVPPPVFWTVFQETIRIQECKLVPEGRARPLQHLQKQEQTKAQAKAQTQTNKNKCKNKHKQRQPAQTTKQTNKKHKHGKQARYSSSKNKNDHKEWVQKPPARNLSVEGGGVPPFSFNFFR